MWKVARFVYKLTQNSIKDVSGLVWFNPLQCFFGSEGHVALDRNPGTGYDTLLLRMIPGDLLSAFPHRQFQTLPSLLDSWAALPNSHPNALRAYAGRQFVPFLWWSLVWPGREANSRPTVREADTLLTEPTRHGGRFWWDHVTYDITKNSIITKWHELKFSVLKKKIAIIFPYKE